MKKPETRDEKNEKGKPLHEGVEKKHLNKPPSQSPKQGPPPPPIKKK